MCVGVWVWGKGGCVSVMCDVLNRVLKSLKSVRGFK